jgi:ABC-type glycerol-3-phosphate transport system permease component
MKLQNRKNKLKRNTFNLFDILNYAIFGFFTLLCFYPFYYIIINTISNNVLSASGQVMWYPVEIHFTNYIQILKLPGLLQAAFISVARTVLGTIFPVLVSAFLGFMFTQEKMWGRKTWYRYVLITMYFNAGLIPWYLTMMNLGLINNFLAYIVPALVQPFNIILVKTYVESTPKALQDAAEIDGASVLGIFWRIILPIITPILATIAIFSAVGQWNSFYDTLLLMTDQKYFTLQFVLYRYLNQANLLASLIRGSQSISAGVVQAAHAQTAMSVRMTVTVVVVLPILLVYPFFQKYFIKGIMIGAIKG